MRYAFEDFVLNTDRVELTKAGCEIAVEPKVFGLLHILIENRDKVLGKDELIERIWDGRIVSDAAISSCVKMLRKVLDDDGKQQRIIRTVHGRGFRFVAAVDEIADVSPDPALEFSVIEPPPSVPFTEQSPSTISQRKGGKPSIVVLPFQSFVSDGPEAVFSEALPHELIQALSRLRWIRVIARGTAFRFRTTDPDLGEIGRRLGVTYALCGSISRLGDRLAITIELSDCETGDVVWADRFETRPGTFQEIRHEIVARVISSLEIYVPLNEAGHAQLSMSEHLDAWANYHLGLRHMFRFTKDDNSRAAALFERAIAQDPAFARAHAGLSFTNFQDAFVNYTPDVKRAAADARRFAERSVELDPFDPFSNFTLGRVSWLEGEPAAGQSWLERAVSLSPNFAQGHYSRSFTQMVLGESQEALESADIALKLSPLDPFLYAVHAVRAWAAMRLGDMKEAAAAAERAARAPGAHFLVLMIAAMIFAAAGNLERARYWSAQVRKKRPDANQDHFFAAFPFANDGFRKKVSDCLKDAGF
jgi:DNA-binding winged helix-turn-helix (wHTH) protein/tetratricopeptide (TPR) repeat protein